MSGSRCAFVAFLFCFFVGLAADADPLQGFVREDAATPTLQALSPHLDVVKPREHCSCINPDKVQALEVNGEWRLMDDGTPLVTLRSGEAARAAAEMIRTYAITDICSLGGSGGAFNPTSVYFKSGDAAPDRAIAGEDAIKFDNASIKVEQRNGSWKVTSAGDVWLLDFGADESAARNAAEIIRYYGFTNQCFVGAPNRELMYWHK